ncbi:cyclase family protein [Streptomyces xanthochromogenes]|uniref:Cyclase n=1 Tax=Streptomyces xanthochromogenes TaxID=67384 RepID=A0ABQ2ZEG1_9ACTN|nr:MULTISPECIES: cyclase family protein [Streptomyces]MYV93837.1 cyclase family protein [Streptomyces sp. SID1034]GGY14280.1 cyclase [Streptomyces xanthochromogenes]
MVNTSSSPRTRTASRHTGSGAVFVDLSHEIVPGATAYPGLPQPVLTDHISREQSRENYAPGTEFHLGMICMMGQTGTYMDVPHHRYADGYDLAALDLARVAHVPVTVVDTDQREIQPEAFAGAELTGRAVLIRTGWSGHWGTDTYGGGRHPHLSAASAALLAEAEPAVVGIDSTNIDDTTGRERPAHTLLLGAGIPLVEHLTNLSGVPAGGGWFTAAPVKFAGLGTFPVRAFLHTDRGA